MYARILIEVGFDQNLPEIIQFMNAKGIMVDQRVNYEWRLIKCTQCNGIGHEAIKCIKKNKGKWVQKRNVSKGKEVNIDEEGFQMVGSKSNQRDKIVECSKNIGGNEKNASEGLNKFTILESMNENDENGKDIVGKDEVIRYDKVGQVGKG